MADNANPFANVDFQSLFPAARLPGLDFEEVLAAQKKNVEALISANQAVAEGYQAVAKRQVEIVQTAIQDTQDRISALIAAGTPEDQIAQQCAALKTALEEAQANMRELSDLVQKSQAEAGNILNRRLAESVDELKDLAKS